MQKKMPVSNMVELEGWLVVSLVQTSDLQWGSSAG